MEGKHSVWISQGLKKYIPLYTRLAPCFSHYGTGKPFNIDVIHSSPTGGKSSPFRANDSSVSIS